jgi:hypothetical protein
MSGRWAPAMMASGKVAATEDERHPSPTNLLRAYAGGNSAHIPLIKPTAQGRVLDHQGIARQQADAFHLGLRDENAIEGILVNRTQVLDSHLLAAFEGR